MQDHDLNRLGDAVLDLLEGYTIGDAMTVLTQITGELLAQCEGGEIGQAIAAQEAWAMTVSSLAFYQCGEVVH